ncbi:MAG TPA: DUF1800 domain-containing protein [Candidatus Margulisiibacteriota bacterium]|nr:DUF1800 domain-containing protein [Candidatus Margulisiibacteriota bacterium]
MGSNANAPLSQSEAQHLLRRTGFGATADKVKTILKTYPTRGKAADYVLNFKPAKFKPGGKDIDAVRNNWIKYMLGVKAPLQEKLVLFWHDHFATGNDKVDNYKLMAVQNQLLRQFCKGDFKAFVKAINKNAAMMEYLDTVRNRKREPNENYARELEELFTLGVKDFNGNPNYTQEDIVQIARAFSGWDYDGKGVAVFEPSRHDFTEQFPERGPKVIYTSAGGFGAAGRDYTQPGGEGPTEIDQVIDIIFQHKDSDGKNTVARYIANKLFTYLANATPAIADIDTLVADAQFDTAFDIGQLVRAILINDAFYATAAAAPFTASTKKSVKWPTDYVVTTLRLLGMKLKGADQHINFSSGTPAQDYLSAMGQILLEPPSVFGWDWETAWLSSATLLARYQFATDVIAARGKGATSFRPEKLIDLNLTDAGAIVDAVTDLLGVTDQLAPADRNALISYLTDGNPSMAVNLNDDNFRTLKLNGLFGLVLQSPAYQLH